MEPNSHRKGISSGQQKNLARKGKDTLVKAFRTKSFCEVDDDDRLKTDQEIYSAKARFATGMKGYTNVLESQNNNLMNISSAFIVEHYRPELDMLPVAAEIMQDPSVRDICG